MKRQIVLDNYNCFGEYILWDGSNYTLIKNVFKSINGLGGFTEDNMLVGLFEDNNNLYFIWGNKEYEIVIDTCICSFDYISGNQRCFSVESDGICICKYIYKPFLDPHYLLNGSDGEEYDFLLYLKNNVMKNKVYLTNFLNYMRKERK